MDATFVERERDRMLKELSEFLAIPSISTLPTHAADCRRAASWAATELRTLGCPVVEIIENKGNPIVWAESPKVPGKPTILIYGHYDVQPPDPLNEWHSPPFEPTVRDGKLFARGAVDDKGQVYCLFKAYEAARDANRNPPLNVHWILEGEEECGGEAIDDLLKAQPERTAVDAVLVCDAGYYAPGIPAVYTALRGMCYAEISVRTALSDLHSGLYGGAVPNALETLVRLLSQLKDDSGKINVPRLYKSVIPPTKAELKAWKSLPFKKKQFMEEETTTKTLTGLKEYSVFERLWALPTFDIHGIMGGFTGEGAKTVIPAQATAKVSLRLVPGLEFEKVLKQLDTAVQRLAPSWAEVSVRAIHGADPVQIDVSAPAFAVLDQAFEEVVGRKTVAVRSGGSIPVVSRLGMRGAPVLLTGVGLPDDGLHAPNEKIDLDQVWDGINVFGRFFELLAERGAA
ncbi:MAG TPA: dipeptidase [Gemmatimonadales bacterium]|nr:dipeptidase [Gemmatimonadales bacterium]